MSDPIKVGVESKIDLFYDANLRKFTATLPDGKPLSRTVESELRKAIRQAIVPKEAQFAYYIENWFSKYSPPDHGLVRIVCRRGRKYEVEYIDKKKAEDNSRFTVEEGELYKPDTVDENKVAAAAEALKKAIDAWGAIDKGLVPWEGA